MQQLKRAEKKIAAFMISCAMVASCKMVGRKDHRRTTWNYLLPPCRRLNLSPSKMGSIIV
jgi:hypothetical protein